MHVICLILYDVAIVLSYYISCFCGHMAIVFLPYTHMKLVNYLDYRRTALDLSQYISVLLVRVVSKSKSKGIPVTGCGGP
jgi:Cdc6-like AAA superfamily ATPase